MHYEAQGAPSMLTTLREQQVLRTDHINTSVGNGHEEFTSRGQNPQGVGPRK